MRYGESGWSQLKIKNPEAETENGRVRGFNRNGNGVFLGIPYGGPCDKDNRFKAPVPAGRWDGVRDCTGYGPVAMQELTDLSKVPDAAQKVMLEYGNHFTGGITYDRGQQKCSENCLVLNVVTPGIDEKERPVMVYIHGGGYTSGDGNVTASICDRLVDEEDVVIVTINHRLNIFGYLYLGGFDPQYRDSGLVGLLDLILALQWIHENIRSFGGNPENVTLIGESGGGSKIAHLMAMPEAKGLFTKAINMSGSLIVSGQTQEESHRQTLGVLEKLGIEPDHWRRLLELPAETLLLGIRDLKMVQKDFTPFIPTADGIRLPVNPDKIYTAYNASEDVSLLVGASEEELAMNVLKNPAMSWQDVRRSLLNREFGEIEPLPGLNEENVDDFIQTFRDSCGDEKQPWQIFVQILSMCHYLGGGAFKAAMAKAAQKGALVWHYMTTYDSPFPGLAPLACAWHTADLPLAFRAVYHKEAEELSRIIAHSFAAFARTGNPQTGTLLWPPFTTEDKQTMIFDETCVCVADPYQRIHAAIAAICKDREGMLK